jgi:DNA-binding response OmpR family regulator
MKPKIIIQDSNLDTANALRSLIGQIGYPIITIKTLKGLNSLIVKMKPNLLIIECHTDSAEARAILSNLKKKFNMKVIATSCDDNRTFLVENVGFDDCLTKPFNMTEVHHVISKQLAA